MATKRGRQEKSAFRRVRKKCTELYVNGIDGPLVALERLLEPAGCMACPLYAVNEAQILVSMSYF